MSIDETDETPGILSSCRITSSRNCAPVIGDVPYGRWTFVKNVMFVASIPKPCFWRRSSSFPKTPAPVSNVSAAPTWTTSNPLCTRVRARPADAFCDSPALDPPVARLSATTGMNPVPSATITVSASANSSTRQSSTGTIPRLASVPNADDVTIPHRAISTPSDPPISAIHPPSTSSCCASRALDAPSARRTDIS